MKILYFNLKVTFLYITIMRKIWIDCGCRHGEGFGDLAPKYNIDETWEIFAFEVEPNNIKQYENNINSGKFDVFKNKNITLINKGVWDKDCILKLHREKNSREYYDNHENFKKVIDEQNKGWEEGTKIGRQSFEQGDFTGGNTLGPLFKHMDRRYAPQRDCLCFEDETIDVECIDFSEWVKNNFKKEDYIILKMDIEGAEFNVLPKMIANDTLSYVNKMIIEWHDWEFPTLRNKKIEIQNYISKNYKHMEEIQWR